jgi:transposase InsO family protein
MHRLSQSCESLPSLPATVKHLCDTCELAKARRQPFPASDTPAVPRRLQFLHMDTLIFEVPSLNGHRYALIIVDDHTRAVWVHLMRRKDETTAMVRQFLKGLSQRFPNDPVQTIRTGRGGEFGNPLLSPTQFM